ncbi:hypothetical protein G5714_000022 [Onychostoma macrolepis]|uniref:Uncharacterized protein n=1 Tax=Onychostoma macrolepis TaxID=369639 RepID=A0A7J6DFV1_9TELE|nr:hypothetical protein G5714_000022 [Onychostoma macrolepis]
MKSGNSLLHPPEFSDGPETSDPSITRTRRSSSPEPSYVSLKSDRSMKMTHHLSYKTVTTDHLVYRDGQTGALKQDPPGPPGSTSDGGTGGGFGSTTAVWQIATTWTIK